MDGAWFKVMFGTRREWVRDFAVATAAGLFLGLMGPFGSFLNGSGGLVVAYWVGVVWLGTVVFGVAARAALRFAPFGRVGAVVLLACVYVGLSALLSVICRLVAGALWPIVVEHVGFVVWYGETLLTTLPFGIFYAWLNGLLGPGTRAADEAGPKSSVARLPAQIARDVLALQMEDHYVRVHTAKGSTLVLMPLSQALAELRDVPGLRVHRSWWVAKAAVQGAVQDGRNVRLRLSNGVQAPVARASVAAARAAGYF